MNPVPQPVGVASPCINVCRMDSRSGLCEGCQRTLDEIAVWGTLDDAGKAAIWQRIAVRRAHGFNLVRATVPTPARDR